MTTPQITPILFKDSPYYGMILPYNPLTPQNPYTNPVTGKPIPNLSGFTNPEQVTSALGPDAPQLFQNLQSFKTLQQSDQAKVLRAYQDHIPSLKAQMTTAQNRPLPSATPMSPDVSPKVNAAADAALKPHPDAKSAAADYSFKYADHQIKMRKAFTDPDAEGVCYPIDINPKTWKETEKLFVDVLDEHKLLPKDTQKVYHMGFVKHPPPAPGASNKITFDVYFKLGGVVEHRSVDVSPEHIDKAKALEPAYNAILDLKPLNKAGRRSVELSSQDLKKFHLASTKLNATEEHPTALALLQIAEDEAKKLKTEYSVKYTYPGKIEDLVKLQRRSDPHYNVFDHLGRRDLTAVSQFHIEHQSTETQNDQVRILHDISLRSGCKTEDLAHSQDMQLLATKYPLHYFVNAYLGRLDKEDAPKTAHHESTLILLKDKKGKPKEPVMLQKDFEIPKLGDDLSKDSKRLQMFFSVVNQTLIYAEIIKARKESKKEAFTIKDAIIDKAPTTIEELKKVETSVLIRMLAAILVNSDPDTQGPKINLNFELPYGVSVSDHNGQTLATMIGHLAFTVLGNVIESINEETPTNVLEIIDHYLTSLPPPLSTPDSTVTPSESDDDQFFTAESGSEEE